MTNPRIFKVGDSRTVQQAISKGVKINRSTGSVSDTDKTGIYYYAKGAQGLKWFNENISDINQKSKDYDVIVVSLGVNDLANKQKYMAKMKELADGPWKGKQVYFTAVNPVGNGYNHGKGAEMNHKIDEFNAYVRKNLPNNVHFIDTNTYFRNNCNCKYDAEYLHYDNATNKKIDAFVTAEIQKDYAQRVGNQQQVGTNSPEQAQTLNQDNGNSTADKMRSDQQKAHEALNASNGSNGALYGNNRARGSMLQSLFAGGNGEANDGNDAMSMMFAYALIYALTGEFPGTSKTDDKKASQGEPIIVDHESGLQLNMSDFDVKNENFARDLARQMTVNIGKNQKNPKSYTGYAPAGAAYCAGAGAKSFNEVASKYDVFDMGVSTPSCIAVRDKMAKVYGKSGETSNCYGTIKAKIDANPNTPQVFTVLIDNGGKSASGLHYVTIAPSLDKNGEILRDGNGAVQYSVYSFNRDKIYSLEKYNFAKRKGYVFPITEMAAQKELAKNNSVTNVALMAKQNNGRA